MFCITLAGPRIPGGVVHRHKEGISIMLVVDKSGSMDALDMSKEDKEQNRLEALKDVLADFINGNGSTLRGRPDDAIGLVSFALYPDSDCPLTLDHVTLMELVRDVKIADREESQTAIGDALGLAAERLRDAPGNSKVMILLTDGVNNAGYEDPLETARMAAQFGIKIYTIGIGTNGTAPIYMTHPFTGRKYIDQIPVELDEASLTQIAEMTGGEYFRAKDRAGLEDIYEKIDKLEKTKINEDRTLHYDEKYTQFLMIGMLLALLGVLLKVTYYRRSPM
ncbi:MAG: VWA domain-containing protein [Proteobacteria bacterium]|nr:VWA domain-containing protein [Pseudomonadota bacterium]